MDEKEATTAPEANEQQQSAQKSVQDDGDTDIVMTHGAADDDSAEESKEPVQAGIASDDVKGVTNAAKLNNTLRKMEKIKCRKQLAMAAQPKTAKKVKPTAHAISKPADSKPQDASDLKKKMLAMKEAAKQSRANAPQVAAEAKQPNGKKGSLSGVGCMQKKNVKKSDTGQKQQPKQRERGKSVKIVEEQPKIVKKPIVPKEKVNVVSCAVCYRVHIESKINPENPLFKCTGNDCKLQAHKRCLGSSWTNMDIDAKTFKCLQCESGEKKLKCAVCLTEGKGMLTKVVNIDEPQYIHQICGLLCDNYRVDDLTTMVFTYHETPLVKKEILDKDEATVQFSQLSQPQQPAVLKCEVCKNPDGFFLSCLKRLCKKRIHPYCLQEEIKAKEIKNAVGGEDEDESMIDDSEIDEIEGWAYENKLQDYSTIKHLAAQFQDLFVPMLQHYSFFEEHFGTRDAMMCLITADQSVSDTYALKGSKMQKNKRPSRFNLPQRGGKINVVCEEHRHDPVYCCDNKNLQSSAMLMCDYCLLWFHSKCEEVSGGILNEIESYKCSYCTDWDSKTRQEFLPFIESGQSDILSLPKESPDFSAIEHWQKHILPGKASQTIFMDHLLMIGAVWQKQVQAILASEHIVNIDLIRQQIVFAQYIPINLSDGVQRLNALIEKVATHQAEHPVPIMELQVVYTDDGILDHDKLKANAELKKQAETMIAEESSKFKIYSYRAVVLQQEIVDQCNIIENILKVIKKESSHLSYNDIIQLRQTIYRKKQKQLNKNLTEKFFEVRAWLASYNDIEQNCKKIWGQLKTVTGQNAKVFAPKANDEEARRVIKQGEDVISYCDISKELGALKLMMELAQSWDSRYNESRQANQSDGKKLSALLKEAQSMSIKTPTMITALSEMKQNSSWINESQRFFNSQSRDTLTMKNLQETITKVDAVKKSVTAKQISDQLKQIQTEATTHEEKLQKWLMGSVKIESLESLQVYKGAELANLPIKLDSEAKFNNLIRTIAWALDIEHEDEPNANVDLLMAKSISPDFDAAMKDPYQAKLNQVYAEYQSKVESLLLALKKEDQELSLATMKQAYMQGKQLCQARDKMQADHQVVISSIDPKFATLWHWLERCYNRFSEKVEGKTSAQKHEHSIDSTLKLMGKTRLQQLQAVGEQSCNTLLHYSKIAQLLLPKVQNSKHDRDIKHILDADQKSLIQLKAQLEKAQKLGNQEQIGVLEKNLKAVQEWYAEFEELHLADWQIKKLILAGHESQDKLKAKYDSVMAKKKEIQLKFAEGDTRVLNKIHKWNQVALDSRALVNTKVKCAFPPERLHEIDELINCTKRLIEVPEVKQVSEEFTKIKEWDGKIQELARTYPVDLTLMREEIENAKKVIAENYHTTFDYYLEQISKCETWCNNANKLFDVRGTQQEALELIKQVEEDPEGDMKLINLDLYARVKAYAFAKIFELQSTQAPMGSALDFIKHIKQSLPKDLSIETTLVEAELQIADVARRVKNFETRKLDFEVNVNEARQLIGVEGTEPLPFVVSDKLKSAFQTRLDQYLALDAQIMTIMNAEGKPRIEDLNPLLAQLKTMKVKGDIQSELQSLADDHSFVASIWFRIDDLQKKMNDDEAELADEALDYKQIKKAVQIMQQERFACDEAQRVIDWYEEQLQKFKAVKAEIDQFKLDGGVITLKKNQELQNSLPAYVDFGRKEQAILQDLWHSKVDQLLATKHRAREENEEIISSDYIKYWLDEANSLDLLEKEVKFMQLSEIETDVENLIKAIKACTSKEQGEEVFKFAKEEMAPRLCLKRLENEFQTRLDNGLVQEPKVTKGNQATPIEFLRWQMKKKTLGEDAGDEAVKLDFFMMEADEDDSDDELMATDDEAPTTAVKDKKPKAVKTTAVGVIKAPKIKKEKAEKAPKVKNEKKAIAKKREAKVVAKTEKVITVQEQKLIDMKAKKLEAMKARIEANKKAALEKPPEVKKEPAPKPAEPAKPSEEDTKTTAETKKVADKKPEKAKKEPAKKKELAAKKDPSGATKKEPTKKKDPASKKEPAKKKAGAKSKDALETKEDSKDQAQETSKPEDQQPSSAQTTETKPTLIKKDKPVIGIKGGIKFGANKSKLEGLAKKKLTPSTSANKSEEDQAKEENNTNVMSENTADSSPAKALVQSAKEQDKQPVKVVAPTKPIIGFKRKLGGALGGAGGMKFGGGSNISEELKKRLFS